MWQLKTLDYTALLDNVYFVLFDDFTYQFFNFINFVVRSFNHSDPFFD